MQIDKTTPNEIDSARHVPQHETVAQQPEDPTDEVTEKGEDENLQEADLLNLGMPDNSSDTSNTPAATAANPSLDIFSGSSQNESDLLGGFGASAAQAEAAANSVPLINNSASADLLFGHGSSASTRSNNVANNGHLNMSDLLFGQNQASSNVKEMNDLLFDPLGGSATCSFLGGLAAAGSAAKSPSNPDEGFPRNASVPNFAAQASKDPFANLAGSLGAGLAGSWNGTPRNSNTPQSASPAPASTPIHSSPNTMHKNNAMNNNSDGTGGGGPDAQGGKAKEKTSGDAFEDLLGSQGYNFFSSRKAEKDSPKTINQMRKVEAARTMDPDRMKIAEWTEGKKGNLRALLCSLHTVLWPEAERWQRCEMHQLVTAADVKKAYRKACLAVHPDKVLESREHQLARFCFFFFFFIKLFYKFLDYIILFWY